MTFEGLYFSNEITINQKVFVTCEFEVDDFESCATVDIVKLGLPPFWRNAVMWQLAHMTFICMLYSLDLECVIKMDDLSSNWYKIRHNSTTCYPVLKTFKLWECQFWPKFLRHIDCFGPVRTVTNEKFGKFHIRLIRLCHWCLTQRFPALWCQSRQPHITQVT